MQALQRRKVIEAVAAQIEALLQRNASNAHNSRTFTGSTTRLFKCNSVKYSNAKDPFVSYPAVHTPSAEEAANIARRNWILATGLVGASAAMYYVTIDKNEEKKSHGISSPLQDEHLVNWSGTHECVAKCLYQPESQQEVEAIVAKAHEENTKLRCVGSGLSPNGIAFQEDGMISLALMDEIVSVDEEKGLVTVQSGARVQDVADRIKPYGLTLQNYASIREQTIGGFVQIGAHGTGAAIPPVDDSVVGLTMVTPAKGTLHISENENSELFHIAKVGLGCLGIVTEVTFQCVPAHKLVEKTFVTTRDEVKRNHNSWIKENKHLRYMWIPSTDSVVVVQCNPEGEPQSKKHIAEFASLINESSDMGLHPLQELVLQSRISSDTEAVKSFSATECRDLLLAKDPLNPKWVAKVNQAEAEFWKSNEGIRIGYSDDILGFDCGGEQWVYEVAFPTGTRENPDGTDIRYMEELLKIVSKHKIPAPSPIEQRWTCGSSSEMSPCHGSEDSLFSWVGIIMYLPDSKHPKERSSVTQSFSNYQKLVEREMLKKYGAVEHWAKIEMPKSEEDLSEAQYRLRTKYPITKFQEFRKTLDPKNVLGNSLIDALFQK